MINYSNMMDLKLLMFFFSVSVFFNGIFSTNSDASNCSDYRKYNEMFGCTCGFYGFKCYNKVLKLVGEGMSFIKQLQGDFDKIEDLDISGNEEAFSITATLFLPFLNLKTLRIHNCNVVDIEPGAFRSLQKLDVLEISGNSFLTFDSITNGLNQLKSPDLKVFNISGNHNAEELPGAVIKPSMFERLSNTSLKTLDMSWTRLISLSASFDFLPHLETLNISGTFLLGSPSCISTMASLKRLSYIAIDHWPVLPRGYESILLSEEPHGLFKRNINSSCTRRKYISEKGCLILPQNLRTVQSRFIDLGSFFLDFSHLICVEKNNLLNHIVSHSKMSKPLGFIRGYDEIKLFDMSNPDVSFEGPLIQPGMFFAMPSLQILRIAGFYLYRLSYEDLEKLVSQNYNLSELDISHNRLIHLPKEMFIQNIFLEYLNISWNKITVFETDLSACVHLLSVDLRQNLLKVIGIDVVHHFTSIGRAVDINLMGNELECDCELLTLAEDMNISTTPFTCSYKGEKRLINQNISQAFVQNVCAKEVPTHSDIKTITLLGGLLGVLMIVVVVITVAVIIQRRRKAVRKRNKLNMPVIINLTDCDYLEEYSHRKPKFIVFLAYCSKDSEFVIKKIYKKLNYKLLHMLKNTEYENDPDRLIIIYDKNFLAGIDIDEICRVAIIESLVTVAIVTENFLESPWCNLEVKMALSSKVPLLPLFITKCKPERLTGFLRVVYEEKVRLLWPDTSNLKETLAEEEEDKLLDTLCTHIISYVRLHQEQCVMDEDSKSHVC